MSTTETNVHKSRWGFHSCSQEEFFKLKRAHKLILRAYQDCKRNIRWNAKDSQNQKVDEPRAPKNYIEKGFHKLDEKLFWGFGFRDIKHGYGNKSYNLYLHILRQYRIARRPMEKPEDVRSLDLPEDFDAIIEDLEMFYAKK